MIEPFADGQTKTLENGFARDQLRSLQLWL